MCPVASGKPIAVLRLAAPNAIVAVASPREGAQAPQCPGHVHPSRALPPPPLRPGRLRCPVGDHPSTTQPANLLARVSIVPNALSQWPSVATTVRVSETHALPWPGRFCGQHSRPPARLPPGCVPGQCRRNAVARRPQPSWPGTSAKPSGSCRRQGFASLRESCWAVADSGRKCQRRSTLHGLPRRHRMDECSFDFCSNMVIKSPAGGRFQGPGLELQQVLEGGTRQCAGLGQLAHHRPAGPSRLQPHLQSGPCYPHAASLPPPRPQPLRIFANAIVQTFPGPTLPIASWQSANPFGIRRCARPPRSPSRLWRLRTSASSLLARTCIPGAETLDSQATRQLLWAKAHVPGRGGSVA